MTWGLLKGSVSAWKCHSRVRNGDVGVAGRNQRENCCPDEGGSKISMPYVNCSYIWAKAKKMRNLTVRNFSVNLFACWHSSSSLLKLYKKWKRSIFLFHTHGKAENPKETLRCLVVARCVVQLESQRYQWCSKPNFSSPVCLLMSFRGMFQFKTRLSKFSAL